MIVANIRNNSVAVVSSGRQHVIGPEEIIKNHLFNHLSHLLEKKFRIKVADIVYIAILGWEPKFQNWKLLNYSVLVQLAVFIYSRDIDIIMVIFKSERDEMQKGKTEMCGIIP